MRIVSWNSSGKFREKFKNIQKIKADIYVIQECENPKKYIESEYNNFAKNYIWIGEKENKGLGIFASEQVKIENNNWKAYCLRNFLSIKVNDKFDVVGVWACNPYIEEYYIYQSINIENYNKKTIIIGDFNSNSIWDKKHGNRNHTNVVNELKNKGLISAYHYVYKEKQGCETKKTFYLYRHKDKGYHIDYCFIDKEILKKFEILNDIKWLEISDHLPIVIEI